MLGERRILLFGLRSLVALLTVAMLWFSVAEHYNALLAILGQYFVPDGITVRTMGQTIFFDNESTAVPAALDGLTLHYGLVLNLVLAFSVVGISVQARLVSVLALTVISIALNVIGIALIALAVGSTIDSGLVFGSFAVAWGLLPALIGGAWCLLYWVPRASHIDFVRVERAEPIIETL